MSTDGTTGEQPQGANTSRVRTSDAEREVVAEVLRNAVTEGRLSLEEGDQRLAALYATKFRDELSQLTTDLPAPETPGGWGDGRDRGHGQRDSAGQGWGRGPGGPGWGRGPGGPGPGGPGWGGPGWGGPGSGGPGSGGPGWDGHRWMRRRMLRFVVVLAIIGAVVTLSGGHFFWPIIPIFFLTMAVVRIGLFRAGMRRFAGAGGCGRGAWHGHGPGGAA